MLSPIMDRALLEEQITQAEGRITRGLLALARAEENIAFLNRGNHVAAAEHATVFLEFLRETQGQHEAHLDRLQHELKNLDRCLSGKILGPPG